MISMSAIGEIIFRMSSRVCWRCETKAHMTLEGDVHRIAHNAGSSSYVLCGLYLCNECRYPSVALANRQGHPNSDRDWLDGRMPDKPKITWFPLRGLAREFPDVPEHIASAASEAYECHSIGAHRAAGAMARAVIEATAKDKGITKGRLIDKIEEMESQGLIRGHIKVAAHEVRHLGNDMAHGDFIEPVDETETAETLELMSEILNEVYQSPAKIARRQAARQAKATAQATWRAPGRAAPPEAT
jgi:hypothetical protein